MSIKTELNRITAAKQAIITSLRNKGASITNSAKIESLASYIDRIALTVSEDGNGNVVIEGMKITDANGNVDIGG